MITGKYDNKFGDEAKLIQFAAGHPKQFWCAGARDGYWAFVIHSESWRIHKDDYLAILSGKLRPELFSHVPEDLEKEFEFCADKVKGVKDLGRGIQNGKINVIVVW